MFKKLKYRCDISLYVYIHIYPCCFSSQEKAMRSKESRKFGQNSDSSHEKHNVKEKMLSSTRNAHSLEGIIHPEP